MDYIRFAKYVFCSTFRALPNEKQNIFLPFEMSTLCSSTFSQRLLHHILNQVSDCATVIVRMKQKDEVSLSSLELQINSVSFQLQFLLLRRRRDHLVSLEYNFDFFCSALCFRNNKS